MLLCNILATIIFALNISCSMAVAAEISILRMPEQKYSLIFIKGEIEIGDSNKFHGLTENIDRATVVLESPGGSLREGLQIGAETRLKAYATMVLPEAQCYSVCGLIWVSGSHRYMSQTSVIGFHAAYRKENGQDVESGMANAEIGSYLTHLGLRIEAIRFFTVAGPTEVAKLSLDKARSLGIDVYEQNGMDTVTPQQKPTVDTYVEAFVYNSFLHSACVRYFQPNLSLLENASKIVFQKGNEFVDHDQWASLMDARLNSVIREAKSRGLLNRCVEVATSLLRSGMVTGISGPSFECSGKLLPTERTICLTENLWAKDRAIGAIYNYLQRGTDKQMRRKLAAFQHNWLVLRDRCNGDEACINRVYDNRIAELKDFNLTQ